MASVPQPPGFSIQSEATTDIVNDWGSSCIYPYLVPTRTNVESCVGLVTPHRSWLSCPFLSGQAFRCNHASLEHGLLPERGRGFGWEDLHDAGSLDKITNMVNSVRIRFDQRGRGLPVPSNDFIMMAKPSRSKLMRTEIDQYLH